MENHNKNTELDRQLQELASCDWEKFVKIMGENNIQAAKICMLRSKGQSYNQIALRLRTTFSKARTKVEKCDCNYPPEASAET